MNEGTPGYLTGDIEAPQGEKDMGGWTMRAYTPEQQARLHVDEMGKAADTPAVKSTEHVKVKQEEPVAKPTSEAKGGQFRKQVNEILAQAKRDVSEMPRWLLVMLAMFCTLMSFSALVYGR